MSVSISGEGSVTGIDQGLNIVGVVTATQVKVGSAVTIHSGGFQIGSSDIHSTGIAVNRINIGTGASISSPATNVLTLGTNNSERVRIDSSGNVGIGSISASAKLHIRTESGTDTAGSSNSHILFDLADDGGPGWAQRLWDSGAGSIGLDGSFALDRRSSGTWTNVLTAKRDTGNLGIGTTNPGAKLHVSGTGRFSESLYANPLTLSSSLSWINSAYGAISNSTVLSLNNLLIGQNIRGYIGSIDGGTTDNSFRNIVTYGAGSMGHAGTEYCFGGTTKFYNGTAASTANTVFTPTLSMQIDGSGRVTMPSQPMFSARTYSSSGNTVQANIVAFLWSTIDLNVGNSFNNTTGLFTAPVAGNYAVSFNFNRRASFGNWSGAYIVKNSTTIASSWFPPSSDGNYLYAPVTLNYIINLAANDTIAFCYHNSYSLPSTSNDGNFASIFLVG
jgi:hypothetical protein